MLWYVLVGVVDMVVVDVVELELVDDGIVVVDIVEND